LNYIEGIIKNTEFFTTTELAKKLKMNVQVITRKVQGGEIRAYKIGKEWRIPEPAVFEWLEANANSKKSMSRKEKVAPAFSKTESVEKLPTQHSKRKYLLEYILAQFEPGRAYSEDEIDRIIKRHHDDATTVRREFISENMMNLVNSKYHRRTGYRFSE